MTETLAAIVAKFNGNLVPSPFTGNVYYDHVPPVTAANPLEYPYCVLKQILGKRMVRTFGEKDIEYPAIQFNAYSNAHDTALAAIESVASTFDYVKLTLTSGLFLAFVRRRDPFAEYRGQDQNKDDVYAGIIQYDSIVQKN